MNVLPKKNIIGILVNPTNYGEVTEFVISAARERRAATVSALAVHGVMTGVMNAEHKFRLNTFDFIVPDGQPVKWALNLLHGAHLSDRVYGPNLTLRICEEAAAEGLSIYFYGTTSDMLSALHGSLKKLFPALKVAGMEPSKFRRLTPTEKNELAARIRASGASLLFIGLGCPRQEVFAYEFRSVLNVPIIAVGAAFPFIAGFVPQAPRWMQDRGLEWLFRLSSEPKRLWRRYLYLNPTYVLLILLQMARVNRFQTVGRIPTSDLLYG